MDINALINQIEKEESIDTKIYLYKKAIENHPDHIKLKYYYSNALIAKNSLEDAEELNQLFDELIGQNLKPVTRLYSSIHKAQFLMHTKNYTESRTLLYKIILDGDGKDFFGDLALYYLGILELKIYDYEKAKEIFKECIATNDNKIVGKSYLYLIDIATEEENYDLALEYIHEIETKTDINKETILIKKAKIYRLQEKFDEAHDCLDSVNTKHKSFNTAMSKFERARLYTDEEKYDQARSIYNDLNKNGYLIDKIDSYYELGVLEEKVQNYDQAKRNFKQMLKIKETIQSTYIKY